MLNTEAHAKGSPGTAVPEAIAVQVAAMREERGERATALYLQVGRATLARVIGRLPVRRGTLALLAQRLPAQPSTEAA